MHQMELRLPADQQSNTITRAEFQLGLWDDGNLADKLLHVLTTLNQQVHCFSSGGLLKLFKA